jgi:hypothetical protein
MLDVYDGDDDDDLQNMKLHYGICKTWPLEHIKRHIDPVHFFIRFFTELFYYSPTYC